MRVKPSIVMTLAGIAAIAAAPAFAQKSKDTIRIAINDPFSAIDTYQVPHEEGGVFNRAMYGRLISFNEYTGKFVPGLAKAWRRINPTTLEFDLRDDVYYHSGNKFTAEDVKYTFDWLADPKVRIRFKARYLRLKELKIINPYKVRVIFKQPNATDLSSIAYRYRFYDSKIHKSLEKPATYGRVSASSTGPYKLVSFETGKGFALERFDKWWNDTTSRAPVKRIEASFIPDRQTQKAQLLTNGIDLMRDITADDSRNLATAPGIAVTPTASKQIMYLTLDAAGRSDSKALKDERVRKAIIMAIDRDKLINTFVPGGSSAERPKSICFKSTTGCSPTTEPLKYDLAGAKKLLKEAGHEKGLNFTFYVYAPIQAMGEAIAGELKKAGISVKIQSLKLQTYVRLRGQGKFTAFLGKYPTSAQPDVDNMLNFFMGANRDYYKDPIFKAARDAGSTEFDLSKRTAIYQDALDQVNKKAYIFPLTENPIVFAHRKDVKILANKVATGDVLVTEFAWK